MIPRLYVPSDDAPDSLTVADVIAAYLAARVDQVATGFLTQAALEQSQRYLGAFNADLGEMAVTDCRRGDLKRWVVKHPEYKSPHTKQIAVGQVVAAFRWAVEDGLIDVCPYARPRDLPACEPRCPITRDEVRRILNYARLAGYKKTARAFRIALWFLLETGARTCEMRELRWEHYDDARGVFELRGKTTGKTGRKRLLVLNSRAWRLIRWLRRTADPSGRVFSNSQGKPWDRQLFARRFRSYADAAGVRKEVSAYSCRHGFCVERLEAGAGERQLADLMGHASTRYVAWYGRGVQSKIDYLRDTADRKK